LAANRGDRTAHSVRHWRREILIYDTTNVVLPEDM
jgi:hypothetical protein